MKMMNIALATSLLAVGGFGFTYATANRADEVHPIVGLWDVNYTSDNAGPLFDTFDQWHSDGLEFEVVDVAPGAVAESRRNLAMMLQGEGKLTEAEEVQNEVLDTERRILGKQDVAVARALFELGMNLKWQRRYTDAEDLIQKSLSIRRKLTGENRPTPWNLMCLGYVQQHEGKLTNAEANIRKALTMQDQLLPKDHHDRALGASYLAVVLEKEGRTKESLLRYRYAANHGVEFSQAHLGRLYAAGRGVPKNLVKAAEWYGKAIRTFGPRAAAGEAGPMIDLTWLLATCDVAELRDGPRAVRLGKKVVAATDPKNPYALEALAAAYAETGQFDKAVARQKEAIDVLTLDEGQEHLESLESRLKLYEAGTPCRDSEQTDTLMHPAP